MIATISDSSASMYVERISGEVFTLGAIEHELSYYSPVLTGEADGKKLYEKSVMIEKGATACSRSQLDFIKRFGMKKERPDKYLHHLVIYSLTSGIVFNVCTSRNPKSLNTTVINSR